MYESNVPRVPIIGAEKLTDLYGGWISFHDASIESVLIERRGPTVTIEFETCDMAYRGDELLSCDRKARVIVRWHGVQDALARSRVLEAALDLGSVVVGAMVAPVFGILFYVPFCLTRGGPTTFVVGLAFFRMVPGSRWD